MNSEDALDPELPLVKTRAKGGTMTLWKKHLDPYVSPCTKTNFSSFLPIIFSFPGLRPSIHISIYLPTAGKDIEFVEEILKLDDCINNLTEKHPDAILFIRGDANVNKNDKHRSAVFEKFCNDWSLVNINIDHPTYHHFVGNGKSDSQLDILLRSRNSSETLHEIHCKLDDPLITSHHDALFSSFKLPEHRLPPPEHNPLAPRIENERVKISWSDTGVQDYQKSISHNLARMRSNWLNSSSEASISILLQSTNSFLSKCAKETNRFTELNTSFKQKSSKTPLYLVKSERKLFSNYKVWKKALKSKADPNHIRKTKENHQESKVLHHRLIRFFNMQEGKARDVTLDGILSANPSPTYKSIKTLRNTKTTKVSKMTVGKMTYFDETVPDGIFESIKHLKTDPVVFEDEANLPNFSEDYRNILDICKNGRKIPPISEEKSLKILKNIRKNVNDFYSITALYLNAGSAGHEHFHFLLNAVISDVNLAGLSELNTIYACVLYKGHEKDKTNERSYRTISTCPLMAKGLDIYVPELSIDEWNEQQAETQFQGEGSSHELAALLLTETFQHSLNVSKMPVCF